MKTLIVGAGQIGKALERVLKPYYKTYIRDKEDLDIKNIDIMHICFPFSLNFINEVKRYQKKYEPEYTVIHSTVPVGVSRKCNAIHSPVRGIHPNLEEGIKTFTKFLGGKQASGVADYFRRAGIKVYLTDKQETTELIKIWSTTFYGIDIEMTKQIKRDCGKNDVPFELWSNWTNTYNMGYNKLEYPEYKRPNLVPIMKEQGGRCTISNAMILHEMSPNSFSKLVLSAGYKVPDSFKPDNFRIKYRKLYNKTWLYSEYIGKERTMAEIANELGCTSENVGRVLRKFDIPTRDNSWAKNEIEKVLRLHREGMNFREIADSIKGRTYNSIRGLAYRRLNIESNYSPGETTKREDIRKKISATLKGESLDEWSGFSRDVEEIIRKSEKYKEWRNEILKRDNYTCQVCGENSHLNAHHIENFSDNEDKRFDIENGITLCEDCHLRFHKKYGFRNNNKEQLNKFITEDKGQ